MKAPILILILIRVLLAHLIAYSGASIAFFPPCSFTGASTFQPVHPLPADQVRFHVLLNAIARSDPSGASRMVLSKATLVSPELIALEIIASSDRAPFPDYQVDSITSGPPDYLSATGPLGSFPVGQYWVLVTTRVYDAGTRSLVSPCGDTPNFAGTLTVYATSGLAPVVEFYHAGHDHYFLTQDANEMDDLDRGVHPGWARTGERFLAYLPWQTGGRVPAVMRFYGLPSAGLDTHFYTARGTDEEFDLRFGPLHGAWEVERFNAFELYFPNYPDGSCPPGTVPVYRLWNQRADSNHRYTTAPAIKAEMIARGYVAEGYGPDAVMLCAIAPQQ